MKKLLLFSVCVLFSISYTQSQTKTKLPEKAPEQQDIQQMMKDAQKELDNMSPEDKKMMEDMGVKIPSLNDIPKVTDQQIQAGLNAESTIVPEKDIARIASISKAPLTASSLPAFLTTINAKVILQLKPESRTKGEEIYQLIKSEHNSATVTGNAAIGLWMMGKAELAIYEEGFEKFVAEGTKGSFIAVKPNMDYYHKKLPKSSPQFFTAKFKVSAGDEVFEENIAAIKQAVDFGKLKNMLWK